MSEEELRSKLGEEQYNELFVHFEAASNSADIGNMERRAIADLTVNVVSTVGVVAAGVIITVGTGGIGTVGYLAVCGGLVTARTGLSYAMKGNSYSGSEALMDTGMAVVDTASLGAGVLISKGVSKATTSIVNRVAARQAARTAVSGGQRTGLRLVTDASEEVVEQITQKGLLSKTGGLALNATKATGRGIAKTSVIAGEGAIDGATDGFLVGMYMQGVSAENWNNGFFAGLNNMLSSGGQMAAYGAAIGVVAAPTLVGLGRVGGATWRKIRGKNSTPDAQITTHVDQVRAKREEVTQRAEQQLQSRNSGASPESDVGRHLSDNADDLPPIYSFKDAQNAASRNGSEVTDEAIADFYQRLDGEASAASVGESRVSGDALEREIHEAWQRADDEGLNGGAEPFSGPASGGPSGGAPTGRGTRSTVSESGPADPVGRTSSPQPPSPTRSNGGPSDSPQARVEGVDEGASVAVLDPPQVKQEVELTEDDLLNFEKMKEQFERQGAEEAVDRSARQADSNGAGTSSSPRREPSMPGSSRGDVRPSQTRQEIQQIREDAQRFFSTESSARQVEASPQPTPAVDGPELLLVRPPEVEVAPHARPLEAPQPVRAPEVNPEVQPALPQQVPHIRPTEVTQPLRTPDLTPNVKPKVGPLHRLMDQQDLETTMSTKQSFETSPHLRPHAQTRIKPKTKARPRPRVRPGRGGGSDSTLLDIPYGLEWVEGERVAVLSSPLLHQYRDPVNLLLRKKHMEKVKTFFGELDVLKWSLPIY
jgi:hypothetical protein